MIDLLDRLVTDAKARVSHNEAQRTRPVSPTATPGTYGAALREQLAREQTPSGTADDDAVAPRAAMSLPRALVLCTTETFCTNCGARYRAPGYSVLAEYAFNQASVLRTQDDIRRIERWVSSTNGGSNSNSGGKAPALPREHRTLTVHAPACEACF